MYFQASLPYFRISGQIHAPATTTRIVPMPPSTHGCPAMRGHQRPNQLPTAKQRHVAAFAFQFRARHRMNQIALAKRWPIQSICFVQQNFMRLGGAGGAFG